MMVGWVVSCTVTFWLQSAVLPQVSLAIGASKDQALVHSTVFFAKWVVVGRDLPSFPTRRSSALVLPQASVARQVRVESKVFPQWPVVLVTVLRMVMVTLP